MSVAAARCPNAETFAAAVSNLNNGRSVVRTPNFTALNQFVSSRNSVARSTTVAPVTSRLSVNGQQTVQRQSRVSPVVAISAAAAAGSNNRSASAANYQSNVETTLRAAQQPVPFPNANQEVQALQFRGVQLNRDEEQQFRGPLPLTQYRLNEDQNPEVLRKVLQPARYVQQVAVRTLRPPTPPAAGPLVIREVRGQLPPAPPVVLRQEGQRAQTPCPVVFREQPPRTPTPIPEQTVEVEGEPVAPPARKVVFERLPNEPAKPQNVLIERWLPYGPQKRRVVFERAQVSQPINPRNLVIEWEQPEAQVEQVCQDLGVQRADPVEYRRRFGAELKQASEIPQLCATEALSQQRVGTPVVELEGDVEALRLVDLDRYGLSQYRRYFQ